MEERENEIQRYINANKPLRFKSSHQFGINAELVERLAACECILVDVAKKLGIPYDPNNPKATTTSHYQPIEQKLRKEGNEAYNALFQEQQHAEKASKHLFKEHIVPTDETNGQVLQWNGLIGVKTVENLVFEQLEIFNLNAVRQPQRFIDELSHYDKRLIVVESLKKTVKIILRLRFPP